MNVNLYLYIADELKGTVSDFIDYFGKRKTVLLLNPEPLDIVQDDSNTQNCLLIFISDNLLKSALMDKILAIDPKGYSIFVPVITSGISKKNTDGSGVSVPTLIGSLHEVMQYRDFWYETWIRLRKQHASQADPYIEAQIEQAKRISTGIAAFLRGLTAYQPLDREVFEADHFHVFRKKIAFVEPEIIETTEPQIEIIENAVLTADPVVLIDEPVNNPQTQELFFPEIVDSSKIDLPEVSEITLNEQFITESENSEAQILENIAPKTMESQELQENGLMDASGINNIAELLLLAETAADKGEISNSRKYLERLLQLEPMNPIGLSKLAVLIDLNYQEENQLAEELFRKALFCHEENALLYFNYGLHLSKNPNSRLKAADMFQRAIEMDASFDKAYLELAICQHYVGQQLAAKANYLQACLINGDLRTAEYDACFAVFNPSPISEEMDEVIAEPIKHPNEDTVVMVTGASSGIGKAVAELFAMNGYKVIITGRRAERLEEIRDDFKNRFPAQIELLSFDVRDVDAVNAALLQLPEGWKDVDILINNAGLAKGRSPIHNGNLNHWETMIDTNIKGLLYITRAISPRMVERQKGFIINIGSVAGKEAYADGNVYCATKAAVDMLTKGMRLDLHKHGIRVAAVHPGHVETEFALVRFDGDEQKANIYENFTPLTAMDVAETVYYIASRPAHINIQDVLMFSTQQASATVVDMSGKKYSE